MSKKSDYESKLEEIITPLLMEKDFILYDTEYVKEGGMNYLRAYIDKEGGITIDDIEEVSRAVNPILDEKDFVEDEYIFEVSSPGLGRALKKDRHFDYSMGEEVEVHTYKPIDGSKLWIGLLDSYDKDTVTIQLEAGENKSFNKKDISVVRLTIDF